jgi:hypothetical protein
MKTHYRCRDFDEISAIISARPLSGWAAKVDATQVYTYDYETMYLGQRGQSAYAPVSRSRMGCASPR